MVKVGDLVSGKFKVLDKLGTGGFATVYRVLNQDLGVEQAIKVLHQQYAEDPKVRERFRREVRTTMELVHAHIVQVREFAATEDGLVYYTMDYVKGRTLRGIIQEEKVLEVSRALRLTRQILQGFGSAHEMGVVHRDMKPENVIVAADRGREIAKILDFGIAKVVGGADAANLTGSAIIGTVAYMAPEQASPKNIVDGRADIYAVGTTLYEMLCGETPFKSESALGFLMQHQFDAPPPLSQRAPDRHIPEPVEALVMRSIAKSPDDRFLSCEEMIAAIDAILGGPPTPSRMSAASSAAAMTAREGPKSTRGAPPASGAVARSGQSRAVGTHDQPTAHEPQSQQRTSRSSGERSAAGAAAAAPGVPVDWDHPLEGQTAGKYRILSRLGEGGFGAVVKAEDTYTGRKVALKLLRPELTQDSSFVERFRREARAIATLEHPNIPMLYEYGEIAGTCFMALALVPGEGLDRLIAREGALEPGRVVQIFRQVLQALGVAHARGIVHRDLKPSNIMVQPDGRAMVLDFGIAKLREPGQATGQLTTPGAVMGTPRYMSPEQARGRKLDARSDLYSLGVALFEAFAGAPPFQAAKTEEVLNQHLSDTPPALSEVRPDLAAKYPANLEFFIVRALSKSADDRFQTADEMAQALEAAVPGVPELKLTASGAGARAPAGTGAPPGGGTKWDIAHVTEVGEPGSKQWSVQATSVKGARGAGEESGERRPAPPSGSKVGLILGVVAILLVVGLGVWLKMSGVIDGKNRDVAKNGQGTDGNGGKGGSGTGGTGGTSTGGTGGTSTGGTGGTGTGGTGGTGTGGTGGTSTGGTGGTSTGGTGTGGTGGTGTGGTGGTGTGGTGGVIVEPVLPKLELAVTSPTEGQFLSDKRVRVAGKVQGGEPASVIVNGNVPAELRAGGYFSADVALSSVGVVTIKVEVEDEHRRKAEKEVKVVVDLAPPEIRIDEPAAGFATAKGEIAIRGRIDDDYPESVLVRGHPAELAADGRFTYTLKVDRDGPVRIDVRAYDRSANVSEASVSGALDTQPPTLDVSVPRLTRSRDVTVSGSASDGDVVSVSLGTGPTVEVSAGGGRFTLPWKLPADGEQKTTVVARDRAGNEAKREVAVVCDTVPPKLEVDGAPEIVSASRDAAIAGKVEAGARLTVDGDDVAVRDGAFRHPVRAAEAAKVYEVVAVDEAGNRAAVKVSVAYKPALPLAVRLNLEIRPERDGVREYVSEKDGVTMAFVPGGKFRMGAADGRDDERPPHEVEVAPFYIDRNEVTWGQFRRFCAANKKDLPPAPAWGINDDHPVVGVSWEDARAYATWVGKRLPTEAEWELACRGPEARKYPWGAEDPTDKRANFGERKKQTAAAGATGRDGMSPFGCYDMAGNVAEWCQDVYDARYYDKAPAANPKGPDFGRDRVIRGGAWFSAPEQVRGAARDYGPTTHRDDATGFRCVVSE